MRSSCVSVHEQRTKAKLAPMSVQSPDLTLVRVADSVSDASLFYSSEAGAANVGGARAVR